MATTSSTMPTASACCGVDICAKPQSLSAQPWPTTRAMSAAQNLGTGMPSSTSLRPMRPASDITR